MRKNLEILVEAYQKAINAHLISSITDERGVIIYVNNKFCDVSKYSAQELMGNSHKLINSGYHDQKFFSDLWKSISGGHAWRGEIKNKAKDGSLYWVDTIILPLNSGEKKQYLSLRLEITEKKKLEKNQKEYIETLKQLIFTNSHRVRKPLTTILGLVDINLEKLSKEEFEKVRSYLKQSMTELDEVTREVDLLLWSLDNKYKIK
ncbi:MAG: PAS domain S-box protein [Bacteroidia bacterium]